MAKVVPSWRDIVPTIPVCFRHRRDLPDPPPPGNHNGASSPFRFAWGLVYNDKTRRDIDEASYPHDYGYTFARLPGSMFADMTRKDWDLVYRGYLIDLGHPRVAALHYRALRLFGGRAWRRNAKLMREWGCYSYDDYLDRHGMLGGYCDPDAV